MKTELKMILKEADLLIIMKSIERQEEGNLRIGVIRKLEESGNGIGIDGRVNIIKRSTI
jgi:hypothetical protein